MTEIKSSGFSTNPLQPMPFDLTTVLGCFVRDARLRELIQFCEEQPQATEREPELEGRYYLEFPHSGFSLLLTGNDVVQTIHVHTRPDEPYHAYLDELPFGLSADTTQAEARELFGPPNSSGGPVSLALLSKPVVYWDLWNRGHYSFHLEYPEQRDSVLLITLSSLPRLSPHEPGNA